MISEESDNEKWEKYFEEHKNDIKFIRKMRRDDCLYFLKRAKLFACIKRWIKDSFLIISFKKTNKQLKKQLVLLAIKTKEKEQK